MRRCAIPLLAAAAILPGCGNKSSSRDHGAVESTALTSALPGGSSAVIGIDVHRVVDTPLFGLFLAMIGDDGSELSAAEDRCGVKARNAARALVVGVPGSLDPQRMTLVVRTSVDKEKIADCARALAEQSELELEVETSDKLTAYRQGDEGTEYVSWIDAKTALLVPSMASDPVVLQEVVTGERLSGVQVELASAIESPASLWAVADLSKGDALGEAVGALPVPERPVAAWAAVDLRDGIAARIGFRFPSDRAAQSAVEALGPRLRTTASRNPTAALFLSSLELEARGSEMVATLALDSGQAKKVYALLEGALPELLSRQPPQLPGEDQPPE